MARGKSKNAEGLIFLKYISNTLEAKQSLLFHLRTSVNECYVPELAA